MKTRCRLMVIGIGIGIGLAPAAAPASDGECAPGEVDPLRLLRQASLDLRGRVPTYEEYEAVRDAADPASKAETDIEAMLQSEEYFATIREYHRSLIWSNVDESIVQFVTGQNATIRGQDGGLWFVGGAAGWYRGQANLSCLDQEQTQFDADGRPIPIATFDDPLCSGPGFDGTCEQEGWVWVTPYWDPSTPIKVCAFDAQTAEVGDLGPCALQHTGDRGCGCGEGLAHCGQRDAEEMGVFRDALAEEPLRIFEWVVREDRPYIEAFTTATTLVNGPLAHFYNNLAGVLDEDMNAAVTYDVKMGTVPELDFDDEAWVEVEREPMHAGVLTTFGYLVRFASNRGRANRFYTAFLCDPFVPLADGLPAEADDPEPNLRERAGCDGCHDVLEPAAAHWGRWRSGGTHGFFDESVMSFETPRPDCQCLNCSQVCDTYYVTPDNAHPDEVELFGGLPLAALWLDEEELANVEIGPAALLDTVQERRALASCTVRNLASHLLGRELGVRDLQWLEEQTDALEADGDRFTGLVRRILADERYRTVD